VIAILVVSFYALKISYIKTDKVSSGKVSIVPIIVPEVLGASTAVSFMPQLNSSIAAPNLSSSSALAYEDNGPVLYSYNPDQKVSIASLTKLMTAFLVMNDSRYDQPITITPEDLVSISPILHLKVGDVVMPSDLVQAVLVGSANDAAMTLANHFSTNDKTFLEQMNAQAQKLGMTSTHYSTPIGFDDPQNYSTARDLQKLVYAVMPVLPFSKTDHAASYSFKSISKEDPTLYSVKTTSRLPDAQPNIGVLKTGFTDDAKQAMVAESNIGGHEVITIVLQSDNRDKDTSAIFDYISKAYSFTH
jgi:D-alanyl-D-alanine carboxypeptidase (penicillin-binding protein 5/6)